jgi:perosamine synthetase
VLTDDAKITIGYPSVDVEEADAAHRVVMSGLLTQGQEVAQAEGAFAALAGTKEAVAVANGTLALEAALRAHGIGPGDEVITTSFSFFATAASIVRSGATPIFVDIDETNFNIDPARIEEAVTSKTAAIMPVHLFGRICDMDAIRKIAERHKLAIIEDAAQGAGSYYKGTHAGAFGSGCFSFYGSKNITCGEGGMITTNDLDLATHVRKLRNHGSSKTYMHEEVFSNYRMTDVQAAILNVQIEKIEKLTVRRQENAAYYDTALNFAGVITPPTNDQEYTSCYHQYTIRIPGQRNQVQAELANNNIDARVFYPIPLHKQPALKLPDICLPRAEKASEEVLSLPVHPGLGEAELSRVVETLRRAVSR